MATRDDFVIARQGDVVISFGPSVAGLIVLGCPKGTWNFNRSVGEIDDGIDNWCVAVDEESAAVNTFSPGPINLDVSGTMEMILDDAAYLAMINATYGATYSFFRSVASNRGDTQTRTDTWGGYMTQLNDQFQGTGPSDVAVGFRANEVVGVIGGEGS